MQLPDKLKAALVAIVLALLFAGLAHAQATGQGYQGPVQFSPGCSGALRYGNMYVCFDTVNNGWFNWSYTANAGKGAFVPIPLNAGGVPVANVACPVATHNAESEGCAIGATTPAAGTFTGLAAGSSGGNINIVGGSSSTANTITQVSVGKIIDPTDPKYGADPTGNADSGAAINAAITAVGNGTVQLPLGSYLITTPINLTNKVGNRLIGAQAQSNLSIGGQATLVCKTGSQPCVDETGSNGVALEHIVIKDAGSSPSCIGILQARNSTANDVAQQDNLNDVTLNLTTGKTGSCNSGYGTIGVFNYASEIDNYHNVFLQADTPLVLSGANTLGITSPYQTIATGAESMTEVSLSGTSADSSSGGPNIWFDAGGGNIYLGNTYFLGCTTAGCDTTAFYITGGWDALTWDGRLETTSGTRTPFELAGNSNLLNAHIKSIIESGNGPLLQYDDASGKNCPYIASSSFRVQNDSLSGSTNVVNENGSGCTAVNSEMLNVSFPASWAPYGHLTITQGTTGGSVTTEGWDPAQVSLPANYHYHNSSNDMALSGAVQEYDNKQIQAMGVLAVGSATDLVSYYTQNTASGGTMWAIDTSATGTTDVCGAGGLSLHTSGAEPECFTSGGSLEVLHPYAASVWSGITANVGASSTDYMAFGQNAGQAVISSEANAQGIWAFPGTASNLQCFVTTAAGAAGDVMVVRLKHSGSTAGTALTCTVSNTNNTCNDTSDTFAVAAGDSLDISVGGGSNTNATGVASCSFVVNR